MRRTFIALFTSFVSMAAIAAGAETPSDPAAAPQEPQATPTRTDPGSEETSGTVTEVVDAIDYTYLEVDLGDQRVWFAAPRTEVAVGDTVFLSRGVFMVDFFSRTLGRTFDEIYLVQTMRVEPGGQGDSETPPDDEGGQTGVAVE